MGTSTSIQRSQRLLTTVHIRSGIVNASIFIFTPHPGPLLPHKPESPPPPVKPRDLDAEAEKVKAQIVAAGVSLGGEPLDVPPPAGSPPPASEVKPPKRRISRAREPPFPASSTSPDPIQRYSSFRDAITARDEELGLAPVGPAEVPATTMPVIHPELSEKQDIALARQADVSAVDRASGTRGEKSVAR